MRKAFGTTALAAAIVFASTVQAATIKVPEGTEFPCTIDEKLSSKTSQEGDHFTIRLDDDVKLSDGTVLKAGYKGVGEIVHLQKNGMVGKKGEINVRFNYLKIGDEQVRLRASKGVEGNGNTGNQIAGIVLVGVFGLLIKGHSAEIPKGQHVTAYADSDIDIETPLPEPPKAG